MRATYDALQPLLSQDLKEQFLGLSSDSLRAEWLRRYWRLQDPTPTTPENERRIEHERRVTRARRDFAMKDPPGWDARGEVLILVGEPDSVIEEGADVEHGIGYVPAKQDWLFFDEKWVAPFERPNPKGPWVLGRPNRLSYRPDVVQDELEMLGYHDLDMGAADDRDRAADLLGQEEERRILAQKDLRDSGLSPEVIEAEVRGDLRAKEVLRKRDEAVWNFTKQFEAGKDRFFIEGEGPRWIWYVFDVDIFKGPPGRMRLEVHYQFNIQDLTFQWKDSLYVARYDIEGLLLDSRAREVARDRYGETLEASRFRSTMEGRLFPGQLVFEVPEGMYRLALRFTDTNGNGEGTYLTDLDVPRLDGRELAISDVEMATKIIYADPSWHPRFVKKDRLVVPNPIGVYHKETPLLGYFEIYGLALDENQMCRYQVTYRLVPRSLQRHEGWFPQEGTYQKPFVTASFTGEGGTTELVEELRIDISELDEDVYDLSLSVTDLVGGGEATTRSTLTLLE
jgi:GWxTD domain-containing protein